MANGSARAPKASAIAFVVIGVIQSSINCALPASKRGSTLLAAPCAAWRASCQRPPGIFARTSGIMKAIAMRPTIYLGDAQVDAAKLAELCQRYGVIELSLFGSVVRGEMGPDSDIDVMVEFDPAARIGILKFESLVEDLEALAGRKIDLVTKSGLKPWVRPEVLREARVIYAA